MPMYKIAMVIFVTLSCAGCWMAQDIFDADAQAQFDDSGTSTGDEYDDVSCSELPPCVVSDVSGYTCPGYPTLSCWNLGNKCNASYLCATAEQACIIVCEQTTCGESTATPPKPICD